MQNGLTGVVISLLALSGSALANSEREKDLIVWLASHDQAIFGRGVVGFDLSEIPWTIEQFGEEKNFLLNVIERAKSKQDWARLTYEPREDWVINSLDKLYQMIAHFGEKDIDVQAALSWQAERPTERIVCPKHNVLEHSYGCVVCNDEDG
jgi:hypothetical protein